MLRATPTPVTALGLIAPVVVALVFIAFALC
jgi:hypothetical protein